MAPRSKAKPAPKADKPKTKLTGARKAAPAKSSAKPGPKFGSPEWRKKYLKPKAKARAKA